MKVDRYEIKYNPNIGEEEYYAVCGKKKIPMPKAFKEMYTDDYLEIEKAHFERPELYDMTDNDFYIPRRTAL